MSAPGGPPMAIPAAAPAVAVSARARAFGAPAPRPRAGAAAPRRTDERTGRSADGHTRRRTGRGAAETACAGADAFSGALLQLLAAFFAVLLALLFLALL